MIQIILEGEKLPETSRDKYSCWEEDLSVQVEMASGLIVLETRGKVRRARWSYDYMGKEPLRRALAILRSGRPFQASVLPDDGDELVTSSFIVTSLDRPTMAFSRRDDAYWHNLSFELREERPRR